MLTKSKKTENTSESDDEYFHDEKGDPTSILRDDSFIYDNNDIAKDNHNYDHHHHNNCDGCIEAAVIHYLIRNRNWTYFKLAIDGLKSVVFQNPSPTWCIASANIWYDDIDDDDEF